MSGGCFHRERFIVLRTDGLFKLGKSGADAAGESRSRTDAVTEAAVHGAGPRTCLGPGLISDHSGRMSVCYQSRFGADVCEENTRWPKVRKGVYARVFPSPRSACSRCGFGPGAVASVVIFMHAYVADSRHGEVQQPRVALRARRSVEVEK